MFEFSRNPKIGLSVDNHFDECTLGWGGVGWGGVGWGGVGWGGVGWGGVGWG